MIRQNRVEDVLSEIKYKTWGCKIFNVSFNSFSAFCCNFSLVFLISCFRACFCLS